GGGLVEPALLVQPGGRVLDEAALDVRVCLGVALCGVEEDLDVVDLGDRLVERFAGGGALFAERVGGVPLGEAGVFPGGRALGASALASLGALCCRRLF